MRNMRSVFNSACTNYPSSVRNYVRDTEGVFSNQPAFYSQCSDGNDW